MTTTVSDQVTSLRMKASEERRKGAGSREAPLSLDLRETGTSAGNAGLWVSFSLRGLPLPPPASCHLRDGFPKVTLTHRHSSTWCEISKQTLSFYFSTELLASAGWEATCPSLPVFPPHLLFHFTLYFHCTLCLLPRGGDDSAESESKECQLPALEFQKLRPQGDGRDWQA